MHMMEMYVGKSDGWIYKQNFSGNRTNNRFNSCMDITCLEQDADK